MSVKQLRIALVAPLHEAVPPKGYGGTERVLSYLANELVGLGHSVTLYAARGSQSNAQLVECWRGTLRETGIGYDEDEIKSPDTAQLERVFSELDSFDVVHIHHGTYPFHVDIFRSIEKGPYIWTEHGAVHIENKPQLFEALAKVDVPMIAISESQRQSLPLAKWLGIVHNGIPRNLLRPSLSSGARNHLVFMGRIHPAKGIENAVHIAAAAGIHLRVAAKTDDIFENYYQSTVQPLFEKFGVDFVGEVGDREKSAFLGDARALLFPIQWLEPFGLVMIEAMACGTPVVAFDRGAVREILEDGKTGFIVSTDTEAVEAVQRAQYLDRTLIRHIFEEKFTSTRMASNYTHFYQEIAQKFGNKDREGRLDSLKATTKLG